MIERERVQAETCACQSRHDHGAAIDCPRSQPAGRRGSHERSRELLIRSGKDASTGVLVTVRDSGPGLNSESLDHLFDALHDQARLHGHGTIDLPFDHHDHRSSRRTVVGYGECTPGCQLSIHPACVVVWRPPPVPGTSACRPRVSASGLGRAKTRGSYEGRAAWGEQIVCRYQRR